MSLNPGGNNYSWNYSKPDKPGYSTLLVGTVLAIQEVQKMGYTTNGQPGAPEFWSDGNPKMNIRLALATETGELKTFTFQPAGKEQKTGRKPSVHIDLYHLTGDTDMMNLIGKTIGISTKEGHYGQGNPRPWEVGFVDAGPFELANELPSDFKVPRILANSAVSGGQMQQPQQPQPMGYARLQQQPVMQQPVMQQQPMMQQQPVMQQQSAMQQQMPQGMDPSVAAAMQQMGAVNVQEVPSTQGSPAVGNPYDDEGVPF